MRTKVINRNDALELLQDGGFILYDRFAGKGTIYNKNDEFVGSLQERTYDILRKHTESKIVKTYLGYDERGYYKPKLTNLEELQKFIPNIEKLTNDDLYKVMNRIQKEISKRNEEDLKK